jgi:predicted ATPase
MSQKVISVLFSGGPHSGKSTIVQSFKKLGYPVAEEAAIQVINDLNETIGVDQQIKFRDENIDEFQRLIYKKQVAYEKAAHQDAFDKKLSFMVCDRGIYDGLTYYKLFNKEPDTQFFNEISQHRYDFVFVCEVLKDFNQRDGTGRFEDYETSKQLSEFTFDAYRPYSDNLLWLPDIGLENRANAVFNAVLRGVYLDQMIRS